MKKYYALALIGLFTLTSGLLALTDAEVKKQANDIAGLMSSGHAAAFGMTNFYEKSPELSMWNGAISRVKTLAKTVIDENEKRAISEKKSFIDRYWNSSKEERKQDDENRKKDTDETTLLAKALEKITKAEIDLVNNIKLTRGILGSPTNVAKQVSTFNQIKNDMLAVEKTLTSPMKLVAKNEVRQLLSKTTLYVGDTAGRAAREASKIKN